LSNGNVLVAGGVNKQGVVLTSAEIYDAAAGAWNAAGDLSVPRAYHTANLLSDGTVLVIGGEVILEILPNRVRYLTYDSAEIYDPATGIWTPTAKMPSPRGHHASTLLADGKVLVIGGDNDHLNQNSAALYDPATGTWRSTGDSLVARWQPHATLLPNGEVLVAGGNGGIQSSELYDPVTGQWRATGLMTSPRREHTLTVLPDGKVLAAGGHLEDENYYTGEVTILDTAELYDPATGRWTATARMNSIRASHSATLLGNGNVLVAAGWTNTGSLSSTELYFPSSPQLTLTSTTYCVGASWTLRVKSPEPDAWIRLAGTSNGQPWEVPNWHHTDVNGHFSETASFPPGSEGAHAIRVDIAGKVSNVVSFSVDRCPL
jgi:hypothetical protein